ncbi:hypothetical protein [Streptomyces xanthochromogenes]|uniref:hypothetical protein n=1 Tax=Streptomyces xanthochromogenes TaxID=67384 RepID=UPI003426A0E0
MSARERLLAALTVSPEVRPGEAEQLLSDAIGADTEAPTTEPMIVRWDRLVIHPEADPTEDTIVCCLTDSGQPVALMLDAELRDALGGILIDPAGGH